ncbi:MAG TPA: transaldolase family protein [Chloroflexota bacterium]|nr:transaldolase family protein [Chloroflexota bacterium]
MLSGYFNRVAKESDTRFWINLPTAKEMELAIAAGAINCTTNPTYGSRLIDEEPEYFAGLMDAAIAETDSNDVAAEKSYFWACGRIMRRFRPMFDASGGKEGFVTVQGDPRRDHDPDWIVAEALRGSKLGPNFMAKIPATVAGIEAIARLTEMNVPICATEVFAVSQAIQVCDRYQQAAERSGHHPPLYLTHITGIFDRYMSEFVQREKIDISPELLSQAGWAVAHEQYRAVKERGTGVIMLGGGALNNSHFTEMVGGDMHVTLNWSIVKSLLDADAPVVSRITAPAPEDVVAELSEKLPDFRKAFYADALTPNEYEGYGPLQLFRTMFLNGWMRMVNQIAARRKAGAA